MPHTIRKAESCCFNGCSQGNLPRVREAAGLRLTEVTYPPGLILPQHSHEQAKVERARDIASNQRLQQVFNQIVGMFESHR